MVGHISAGWAELCNPGKVLYWKPHRGPRDGRLHYLRSILFDAAVVILTLVISLSVPFMALFNASSATVRAVSQVWANGIMFLMKYVVGLDYRVEGREHVPDGPCIIACNHQSLWETAALCVIFPDASIVAKKELKKLPLVGWFLERYPMILVDRSAGRQALRQMVDEARRAVGEGRKVLLFPQGTRQAIDEPMTFQSAGISALYTNLDVSVVPAACNSGLFWDKKTLMMHSGTITLSFLPPIAPGLPRKEFQEKMERMIAEEASRLLTVSEPKVSRRPVTRSDHAALASTTCGDPARKRRQERQAPDELRNFRGEQRLRPSRARTRTPETALSPAIADRWRPRSARTHSSAFSAAIDRQVKAVDHGDARHRAGSRRRGRSSPAG